MSQDWGDDVFIDNDDDDDQMEITDGDADNYTPETFDAYLTALVLLPRGGELLKAQVVGRKRACPTGFPFASDRKSVV